MVLVFLAPHPKSGEHDLQISFHDISLGQQRSGRKESGTSDVRASRAGVQGESAGRQEIARGTNSGAAHTLNHALEARAGRTLGGERDSRRGAQRRGAQRREHVCATSKVCLPKVPKKEKEKGKGHELDGNRNLRKEDKTCLTPTFPH